MIQEVRWSPGMSLEELEKNVILAALQFYNKNKLATSNALGIAPRTLDYKLAKYADDEAAAKVREEELAKKAKETLERSRSKVDFTDMYLVEEERRRDAHMAKLEEERKAKEALEKPKAPEEKKPHNKK